MLIWQAAGCGGLSSSPETGLLLHKLNLEVACCLLDFFIFIFWTKLIKNKNVKAGLFLTSHEKWSKKNNKRQGKKKKRKKNLTKACNKIVPICSAFLTSWPKKQQHLHMFYCLGPAFCQSQWAIWRYATELCVPNKIIIKKKFVLVCYRSNCPPDYAYQTPSGPMMSDQMLILFFIFFVQIKCCFTWNPHSFSCGASSGFPLRGVQLFTFILFSCA